MTSNFTQHETSENIVELQKQLDKQSILYCTEKDIIKANAANFKMLVLTNKIMKIKGIA